MAALMLADLEHPDRDHETCTTVSSHSTDTMTQVFQRPVMVDAAGLMAARFPPREQLLSPWLLSQSLSMIYAPRGIGKTHVALGVSYALASGGEFLGWRAAKPVKVAYLDGEMPGADLSNRVRAIADAAGNEAVPGFLQFMTPDLQPNGVMPNLYDRIGQSMIGDAIGDAQVIIVDNISALVRGGRENEGESWQPVAEWALRMRASGRSVVFIHHAGKGGQQRGTSKREDLLDTVISLRRPGDYTPDEGARFEVHFEKARALYGEDVSPLEATLITGEDGRQEWALRSAADGLDDSLLEMMSLGLSQSEAAKELNVGRSTVIRHLKRLQEDGRYQPKQKNTGGRPRLNSVRSGPCLRCDGEGCARCDG